MSNRVQLPAEIEQKMKLYRMDMAPLPAEYIQFHRELAEKALAELVAQGQIEVISTEMKPDGWCMDSMKELNVRGIMQVDKEERVVYLHWHPGNQEFFIRAGKNGGGSWPLKLDGAVAPRLSGVAETVRF